MFTATARGDSLPLLTCRDPATGRAAAAYREEFGRWQALIDDIVKNPSLTREQRAAAIAGLRERQKIEATAARKRIMDEERQRATASRQLRQ